MPQGAQVRIGRVGDSGSFFDFAGADARRANANVLFGAANDSVHALEVRIPAAATRVIRVADDVAIVRRFAAKLTLQCHFSSCLQIYFGLGIAARKATRPTK
jgi:hypothetical protein